MKAMMGRSWKRAAYCAATAALVCASQISWSQNEASRPVPQSEGQSSPGGSGPTSILAGSQEDDAFEQYASLKRLAAAWGGMDSALMTDAALQFAEGERVLLRSHKAIKASQVLDLAIRMATENKDKESLSRVAKALEKSGDKDRLSQVNLSLKTASAARAVDPALSGGDVNAQLAIQYVQAEIQSARAAGSKSHLEVIAKSLPDLPVSEPQRAALKKNVVEAAESVVENSETSQAVNELDRLGGVVRPISEVKGPIGSKSQKIEYFSEKPDDSELIEMAKNATPESMMVKGIDDPLSALSMATRGSQTPYQSGVWGMPTIWQWINRDGQYYPTNCGTAAAATLLTFYKGSQYPPWSNPNPVRRIELDWLGPDVALGAAGTSRWRMESIATKYGFNYGWGNESQLNSTLAAKKPVAVMLDIGKCPDWKQWGFHWVVVYAVNDTNYYVTNWVTGSTGAVRRDVFLNAWKNNAVAYPMGIAGKFLLITPK